eukprot:TRINITY_DN12089_c0_g1_i1.p1 TRINITY_DN12089_c0_g1~~TRINITY_DN12089_c0_g1_i1.p1  ORF type:complete len:543 (-),score=82.89 TRINITY_DN12089_c0_g1_i1:143-1771(-)
MDWLLDGVIISDEDRRGMMGRRVMSCVEIAAGTVVMRSAGVVQRSGTLWGDRQCGACLFARASLRCVRCRCVRYCSSACQRSHWERIHRRTCAFLPTWARLTAQWPPHIVDDIETALWVLVKINRDTDSACHSVRTMARLPTDFIRNEPRFTFLLSLLKQGVQLYNQHSPKNAIEESDKDLLTLLGQMEANNFSIWDHTLATHGMGVYPFGALLNHSCWPNCVVMYEGPELIQTIRTLRKVSVGEELCHSYLDLAANRAQRQTSLLERYGFVCTCLRCMQESTQPFDPFVAPLCLLCATLPAHDVDVHFAAQQTCTLDDGTVQKFLSSATHAYESGFALLEESPTSKSLLRAASLLSIAFILRRTILHDSNLDLLATRCALHRALVEVDLHTHPQEAPAPENARSAGHYASTIARSILAAYRRIYPPHHPLIGLHLHALASDLQRASDPKRLRLHRLSIHAEDRHFLDLCNAALQRSDRRDPDADQLSGRSLDLRFLETNAADGSLLTAKDALNEALASLTISHGANHSICTEIQELLRSYS